MNVLLGKRKFGDVIKLRMLRWRDYSGLSICPVCDHKSPYKGQTEGDITTEEEKAM